MCFITDIVEIENKTLSAFKLSKSGILPVSFQSLTYLICPTLISACEAAHSEQPVNLMVNKGLHVSKRSSPAKGHDTAPCSHSYDNAQVDWVSWWEKQKTKN